MPIGREHVRPAEDESAHGEDATSELAGLVQATLEKALSFDRMAAGLIDPMSGLPVTMHCPGPPGEGIESSASWTHIADLDRLPAIARVSAPAAVLSASGGDTERPDRRCRTFRGVNGFAHGLRAGLWVDDLCWGYVILLRSPGRPPFSTEETERVESRLAGIARGLRTKLLQGAVPNTGAKCAPGVLVAGPTNTVQALSAHARTMIRHHPALRQPAPDKAPVPISVLIAATKESADHDVRVLVPATGDGGWLVLSGCRVDTSDGGHHIVVAMRSADQADLTPVLFKAWGLTARESAVAHNAIQGLSTVEIAEKLSISGHTVQDHLKAVFAKTGVRSRRDLARSVVGSAGMP